MRFPALQDSIAAEAQKYMLLDGLQLVSDHLDLASNAIPLPMLLMTADQITV